MDTNRHTSALQSSHAAYEAYKRRQVRIKELRAIYSAGTITFTGLLLAALYYLLTQQLSN